MFRGSLTYLWRILFFYNRIAYQSPLYAMGWCRVPRPIFFWRFLEFWRFANHNKTLAHDLMSNQEAHQNSEGTAGRRTKSNLLRMRPDWNCPHTRSDSPNKTWFPLPVNNTDSCSRCDPLVWAADELISVICSKQIRRFRRAFIFLNGVTSLLLWMAIVHSWVIMACVPIGSSWSAAQISHSYEGCIWRMKCGKTDATSSVLFPLPPCQLKPWLWLHNDNTIGGPQ